MEANDKVILVANVMGQGQTRSNIRLITYQGVEHDGELNGMIIDAHKRRRF